MKNSKKSSNKILYNIDLLYYINSEVKTNLKFLSLNIIYENIDSMHKLKINFNNPPRKLIIKSHLLTI